MRQTRTIVFEIFSSFEKNQLPVNNSASGFFTLDASVFLLSFLYSKIIIIKKNIYISTTIPRIWLQRKKRGDSRWNHQLFGIFLRSSFYCTRVILSQKLHTDTHTHTHVQVRTVALITIYKSRVVLFGGILVNKNNS